MSAPETSGVVLGHPGEISADTGTRPLWGTLSTIPFLYILYVLFVELTKSIERQPADVKGTISKLRLMLIGLWGVYPNAYLFPVRGFDGANVFVLKQAGYTFADIFAKAAFGLVIFSIARRKSRYDDPTSAATGAHDDVQAELGTGPRVPLQTAL